MNDQSLVIQGMESMGLGAYVPVVLSVIGLFSAISTVYPPTWPGAGFVHTIALLFGKATPVVPASPVAK